MNHIHIFWYLEHFITDIVQCSCFNCPAIKIPKLFRLAWVSVLLFRILPPLGLKMHWFIPIYLFGPIPFPKRRGNNDGVWTFVQGCLCISTTSSILTLQQLLRISVCSQVQSRWSSYFRPFLEPGTLCFQCRGPRFNPGTCVTSHMSQLKIPNKTQCRQINKYFFKKRINM